MSEYWKSVPRKFCDFCKCWITDNKPSVEFHERGKRHQENVELRLKEVRKKSLKQTAEDDEMKKQMDKMEKAALEAFKKDLKDNPELAAKYGVSLEPKPAPVKEVEENPSCSESEDRSQRKKKIKKMKKKEWREAKSPEGYSYYWSTKSGESRWEAPENFLSVAEQEELDEMEKEEEEEKQKVISQTKEAEKEKTAEESNKEKDQPTKEESSKSNDQPVNSRINPTYSRSAYGSWSVVREEAQPTMYDESSVPPALEEIPLPTAPLVEESEPKEKKPKFKEKTVASLGPANVPVAFKKRKIAGGARNIRQKDGDN